LDFGLPPTSEVAVRTPRPSRWRWEYLLVLAAAGGLYLATVAPGALWQDNGMAQVRVLRHDLRGDLGLALSHPLFYLLAIAFQTMPFAESAYKTNLVASVCGALTVANVYLLLRLLTARRAAAIVGALSLAVAHTFWQHCALAEVYTVSMALMTAEFLCLAQFARTSQPRWLVLLLLANGLGVSNHMLATLNLPVWGVLIVWLLAQRRLQVRHLLLGMVAWLAGASIYLVLIGQALAGGHAPGEVLRSALFGGAYAGQVLNIHLGPALLGKSVLYLGLNYPTPTALLALLGLAGIRQHRWRPVPCSLGVLLAIHLLWAVRYNVPDQYTFFIPTVVLIAIMIGLGADRFLERHHWPAVLIVLAALPPLVYLPLPWVARRAGVPLGLSRQLPYRDAYAYFLRPWKTGYTGPQRFVTEAQAVLPDGAVLLADSTAVRPIHYWMETGRWQRRITLYPGLNAPEDAPWPTEADLAEALRAGRVYVVSPVPGYAPGWLIQHYAVEPAGDLYRVAGRR
jgi:hypothetical protein